MGCRPLFRRGGFRVPARHLHLDGRERLSNLFLPSSMSLTLREDSGWALLQKAGYARATSAAGIFHMLPLGVRVLERITAVLERWMGRIGASKVGLSNLSRVETWKRSGRWEEMRGELFSLRDRRGSEFVLAPTHEEEITLLVRDAVAGPRDLPLRVYQCGHKYRDERRPRGGLLRGREFLMQDLYTFDLNEEAALATYRQVQRAYDGIFQDLGLRVLCAEASSGSMGGQLSHEYHLPCLLGEDRVHECPTCGTIYNEQVVHRCEAEAGAEGSQVEGRGKEGNGGRGNGGRGRGNGKGKEEGGHGGDRDTGTACIEIAHTFHLGQRYTGCFRAGTRLAEGGLWMGCHGIGVTRLMAAVAETHRDARGLCWPPALAPYAGVVVGGAGDEAACTALYDALTARGVRVVLDDRAGTSVGYRVRDAALRGLSLIRPVPTDGEGRPGDGEGQPRERDREARGSVEPRQPQPGPGSPRRGGSASPGKGPGFTGGGAQLAAYLRRLHSDRG